MTAVFSLGHAGAATVFRRDDRRVRLDRLCGVPCALPAADAAPPFAGLFELATSIGRFEGDGLKVTEATSTGGGARIVWQAGDGALQWESTWSTCPNTGVVSRKDVLHNKSKAPVTLFRCRARFVLPPARWEVYAQQSRWCGENQGEWKRLHAGAFRFGCVGGRTTQDGTPYVALREVEGETGLAFHLLPRGNWAIDVRTRSVVNSPAFAVLTLGTAEEDMRLEVPCEGSFEMPEILIQALPQGEPHLAAPLLHRFLHDHLGSTARPELPVVYNTWFDQFEVLELPRLREQLKAARRLGCEVFVVDAGWYGPDADDWWSQAGDWRERRTAAFGGNMKAFADEVRASGAELSGYYEAWYRMLDEIRAAYPGTVFEGCASGGMRVDLSTLAHFDAHFLTDTVHPVDVLRIWQGALLRLPPGRIIKWAVLRSVGRSMPTYTKSLADSPVTLAAPGGALWAPSETVDLDFAVAVALPGMFGFSGDLAGLPEEAIERLAEHVTLFKRWRTMIRQSVAHLLTPSRSKEDRQGWAAVQLEHPQTMKGFG